MTTWHRSRPVDQRFVSKCIIMERRGRTLVKLFAILLLYARAVSSALSSEDRLRLRDKVVEMFDHAYSSYMNNAYPADELMPLSCKGRIRGLTPSRGDIDDVLGNFSLTLIDTLDTLAIMGKVKEFEHAIKLVIEDVHLDNDVIVSVFETNIRVLGGLLGAHVMALDLKKRGLCCSWYESGLLEKATDVGYRLLPAFNTSTGIPYPRVNLKHGVHDPKVKDTCTACAGTMLLEFAALSRLTGIDVFEEKAHKAMDYLWQQRNRHSDLMGTVINIHNGDWVRRESGIGAGIDSYYEYLLKAYILLGEETYLQRFNKHYDGIMRYISQGPLMMNVEMHRPTAGSRNFMDALLAFWPGLQVLKGDLKSAIELHELLYQVTQRHNFLPEAFTTDFHVHWAQHPLRPEFVESTYFLYKATGDPYYLDVGKSIMDNLDKHARVPCGFAAIRDVRHISHEDQMDSYVLAETFKYLYLLYAEPRDLILDVDDYVFTTEAHLLPLSLSMQNYSYNFTKVVIPPSRMSDVPESSSDTFCPNFNRSPLFPDGYSYASKIRLGLKDFVEKKCPKPKMRVLRLKAADFIAGNAAQQELLAEMGIKLVSLVDGRMQLIHSQSQAVDAERAEEGLMFMREMLELAQNQQQVGGAADVRVEPRIVQLMSEPFAGRTAYEAGAAQFGYDLVKLPAVEAPLMVVVEPSNGCSEIRGSIAGHIAIVERGGCMFVEKAKHVEFAGGVGLIVVDNNVGTTSSSSPFFHMSGDAVTEVGIPVVFLFHVEGQALLDALRNHGKVVVRLANKPLVNFSPPAASASVTSIPVGNEGQHSTRRLPVKTRVAKVEDDIIVNIDVSGMLIAIGIPFRPQHWGDESPDASEEIVLKVDDKTFKHILGVNIPKPLARNDDPDSPTGDLPSVDVVYPIVEEVLYRKSSLKRLEKHGEYMRAFRTIMEVAWKVRPQHELDSVAEDLVKEMIGLLYRAAADGSESSDVRNEAFLPGYNEPPTGGTPARVDTTSSGLPEHAADRQKLERTEQASFEPRVKAVVMDLTISTLAEEAEEANSSLSEEEASSASIISPSMQQHDDKYTVPESKATDSEHSVRFAVRQPADPESVADSLASSTSERDRRSAQDGSSSQDDVQAAAGSGLTSGESASMPVNAEQPTSTDELQKDEEKKEDDGVQHQTQQQPSAPLVRQVQSLLQRSDNSPSVPCTTSAIPAATHLGCAEACTASSGAAFSAADVRADALLQSSATEAPAAISSEVLEHFLHSEAGTAAAERADKPLLEVSDVQKDGTIAEHQFSPHAVHVDQSVTPDRDDIASTRSADGSATASSTLLHAAQDSASKSISRVLGDEL